MGYDDLLLRDLSYLGLLSNSISSLRLFIAMDREPTRAPPSV